MITSYYDSFSVLASGSLAILVAVSVWRAVRPSVQAKPRRGWDPEVLWGQLHDSIAEDPARATHTVESEDRTVRVTATFRAVRLRAVWGSWTVTLLPSGLSFTATTTGEMLDRVMVELRRLGGGP